MENRHKWSSKVLENAHKRSWNVMENHFQCSVRTLYEAHFTPEQLLMAGGIMFSTSLLVCYQTCEHGTLKTNEPILLQIGTSRKRMNRFCCRLALVVYEEMASNGQIWGWKLHQMVNFGVQRVIGQGHKMPSRS